ncbi:hypothetical protein BAMA_07070 [Bacillus manliponensis]|uniref:Uncharacterized protein n=1 Tax=Bacillus manliponensis TaxID=574376 RepID=A0A073JV59_9BACI|nr:hypothetical protein [Bacillus manliponensis]KEK18117.1 hypothetical protein BAMA_07070 [Bacillus manliponensis]
MRNIYAFESKEDYMKYEGIISRFNEKLEAYKKFMEVEFALIDPPKGIVWTTEEFATTVFSNVSIPAYTNKNMIYMAPDLPSWRKFFLRQLDGRKNDKVEQFYKNMSENQLFTILAHELTHHSDLFLAEFDDDREGDMWFEEGMCEYLSKKMTLTETEFQEITEVESELVEMFKEDYKEHSLDEFGVESYKGNLTSIMFNYWRSYLTVKYLVEVRANNDIKQVFKEYHNWDQEGRKVTLTEYFGLNPVLK